MECSHSVLHHATQEGGERGKTFDIFCQVKCYQPIASLAVSRPRLVLMLIRSLRDSMRRKEGAMLDPASWF